MSLEYHNNDPGAVEFGNFINYYQFNTPEERLAVFPSRVWSNWQSTDGKLLVLDIGCNAGNFTQLFYKFIREHSKRDVFILGIDIDPVLIERAQEDNAHPSNIKYLNLDFMKDTKCIGEYLSCHSRTNFDVVLCLSITMWIHLNHGDEGLKMFLKRASTLSDLVVIEPQPWKCYRTAVRRMTKAKKHFPQFPKLELCDGVDVAISEFLENECQVGKIYESAETKWKRRINIYRKVVV
ncbi:probable RNA methyltransferase CG11342 [Phlebotomus papatasi]|uniref:probable RNA methyltransferase CG11342 n=1 Tax=Phlebotomus papatasi TaxID=29031 RepID=UPI002483D041|nr:probable RNA methyltransferase CG11342 [Phlebotomus papatasi]